MDAGELTREELQRWVANRFYYQRCIPLKDAAILANCPEVEVRREWIRRIIDHDGTAPGTGGIESWLRLGEALGVPRDELESERRVLPAVRYAVDAYVNFARQKPWIEAVASSLTELFGPAAIRVRLAALEAHYPWIDPAGLEYFRARLDQAPRDAEHALELVVERCADARAAGARRRRAEVQDRGALGAARGDRARRHASRGGGVNRPRLADGARLQYDDVREEHLLLVPEGAVRLNETAAHVLELCDGERSVEDIAAALSRALLRRRRRRRRARAARRDASSTGWWSMPPPRPYTLVAELSYRCPLHCPYCSNPVGDRRRALPRRARDRALDARLPRGARARRPPARADRRRADGAPRPRRARGRRRATAGLYSTLVTAGTPLHARARRAAEGGRARPRPGLDPEPRPGGERPHRRHALVREEARGRARRARARLPADDQLRPAPPATSTGSRRSSRWPRSSTRSAWSSPTRSTTAGRR